MQLTLLKSVTFWWREVPFLVDVNLSPAWVVLLVAKGYNAVRWTAVGANTASDEEIMAYATAHGYAVLTHDQDFSTLLALSRKGKPSVVLLRLSSLRVEGVGDRVLKTVKTVAKDIEAGAIVVIEDSRVRVRSLPMRDV